MITPYHAKYFAYELTRLGGTGVERIGRSLFDAWVDLNLHQIDAALFAMRSPILKGVILADEVGLGKTIEAGNFHPDFMLWLLHGDKQYLTFIEAHGLIHEGLGNAKVQFHQRIKEVEARLGNPNVILNSFILSWSVRSELSWGLTAKEFLQRNILFMREDRQSYVKSLIEQLLGQMNTSII